jgi:nitrate/nitrite transporter NarK
MTTQPLQFSLRRLLLAMACFAMAFAVPMYFVQILRRDEVALNTLDAIVLSLSPCLVIALIGAGFGMMFDKLAPREMRAGERVLTILVAGPLAYGVLHMFWLAVSMR